MERLPRAGMMGEKLLSSSLKDIQGAFVPHFHDFYEIEYFVSGEGVCAINGKEVRCLPGMLCFLTPVDSHEVRSSAARVFNIMFSEQLVPFEQLELFSRPEAPKTVSITPDARPLVEQLCTEIVANEEDAGYCALLMSCLLGKLARLMSVSGEHGPGGMLSKIHAYILGHFRNRLTLDAVADHVGLTPGYVSVLFKKEMGIGFKAYLNTMRLEYAKKLLISTQLPVRQICEESGFEDVPNFIKRFKAYHGATPTEVRTMGQTDDVM